MVVVINKKTNIYLQCNLSNFLLGVKQDMEQRQEAWQKELEELTVLFRKLCKCRKKKLDKENEKLAVDVGTKQKEMLKRVSSANFSNQFLTNEHLCSVSCWIFSSLNASPYGLYGGLN